MTHGMTTHGLTRAAWLAIALLLAACGDDAPPPKEATSPFVGTWALDARASQGR